MLCDRWQTPLAVLGEQLSLAEERTWQGYFLLKSREAPP